jgi:hypothetical protein
MNRTVLFIGGIAAVAAVLRLFTRNIFEPIGVSTFVGSLLVSITVVLLIGMALIFFREGLQSEGRYVRAAGWFVLLAVWCELLVIGGILLTERLHLHSYYTGPFQSVERTFPTGAAHAIGHAEGFWFRTPFLVGVGGIIYSVAKRKRV